jgi:uncharacterized protein (DUF849 family)
MLLEACLNGARTKSEHPAIPRTPEELAAESLASVRAGARVLHLHPYDAAGAGEDRDLDSQVRSHATRFMRPA